MFQIRTNSYFLSTREIQEGEKKKEREVKTEMINGRFTLGKSKLNLLPLLIRIFTLFFDERGRER